MEDLEVSITVSGNEGVVGQVAVVCLRIRAPQFGIMPGKRKEDSKNIHTRLINGHLAHSESISRSARPQWLDHDIYRCIELARPAFLYASDTFERYPPMISNSVLNLAKSAVESGSQSNTSLGGRLEYPLPRHELTCHFKHPEMEIRYGTERTTGH
jgi:hypothetical protein